MVNYTFQLSKSIASQGALHQRSGSQLLSSLSKNYTVNSLPPSPQFMEKARNLSLFPFLPHTSALCCTREYLEQTFENSTCYCVCPSTVHNTVGLHSWSFWTWVDTRLPGQGAAVCVGGQGTRGGIGWWETYQLCCLLMSWSQMWLPASRLFNKFSSPAGWPRWGGLLCQTFCFLPHYHHQQ